MTNNYLKPMAVLCYLAIFSAHLAQGQVAAPTGIKDCINGFHHSIMINYEDTMWFVGENASGQLGRGNNTNATIPVRSNYKVIGVGAAFASSYIILTDSSMRATGLNDVGQLGIGNTTTRNTWATVNSTAKFVQVSGGWKHAVACTGNGLAYAWGINSVGELGDGTQTNRSSPVQVTETGGSPITNVKKVACGDGGNTVRGHTLFLKNDGTVWACGYNNSGELGDATNTNRNRAVQVRGIGGSGFLTGVVDIACSVNSSYALLSDGTVAAWGDNMYGQLGQGNTTDSNVPLRVKINATTNLTNIVQITASGAAGGVPGSSAGNEDFLAGVNTSGKVWSVGRNNRGQLGDLSTTDRSYAVQNYISIFSNFRKTVGTGHFQMMLMRDTLGNYCQSGHQINGSLGNGTTTVGNITLAICAQAPAGLPVDLVSFTANRTDDNTVIIKWATASEINNDHFEIEYSTDGSEFDVVGILPGNGTTFAQKNYQFVHKKAANQPIIYYQLKQVDFNGEFKYANTISVSDRITADLFTVSPNPGKGQYSVYITDPMNSTYSISIMDLNGKVIEARTGIVSSIDRVQKFDLSDFSNGIYFMKVSSEFGSQIEKIIKH